MGNKFKCCGKKESSEQSHQPKFLKCLCNQQHDNSFPYKDFPPPAPPNGRDDLWDLQFCRWWGWNWVRRREAEATLEARYGEPKQRGGCRGKEYARQTQRQCPSPQASVELETPRIKSSPPQVYSDPINVKSPGTQPVLQETRPLPTKKQFQEMCKCLLGRRRKTSCGMTNLYNTPSTSMVAMERLVCGVADQTVMPIEQFPKCINAKCKKKTRQQRNREESSKAQPWSKGPENQEPELTLSEEITSELLCSQKNHSSTEESIEYLSVRLQHIASDIACPCGEHGRPIICKKYEQPVEKSNVQAQTSFCTPQDHKETQTCIEQETRNVPPKRDFPCGETLLKFKGKKHRTICIHVCCCGICKAASPEKVKDNNEPSVQEIKKYLNKNKICPAKGNNLINNFDQDFTVTYPVTVPPSTTKMLSKFGTPSKNYPWMQNVASDATTTTVDNFERFKSPASGKTYDLASIDIDSHENYTLPELIDITEDLSYLKKLETTTYKSDHESRLLLDAVCNAILHDHEETSLDFLNECYTKNDVTHGLKRGYEDFEMLCDLQREFRSKSDVHTELSKQFLNINDDVGMQLTKPSNLGNASADDSTIKFDDIDSIVRIVENISIDSRVNYSEDKMAKANNAKADNENESPFSLKVPDDGFTKAGYNSLSKKPAKRGAPNPAKEENSGKKLKHEETNKVQIQENECIKRAERTSNKIGTIFTKIDDIVKQSKVKSAEIQKVLKFTPSKHESSDVFNETVLETYSLNKNCSTPDCGSIITTDMAASGLKRSYKMSSDSFKRDIGLPPANSEIKPIKKSYDISCDKFDYCLNDYTKNCPRIASKIILEEENVRSVENITIETIHHKNEHEGGISLKKASRLSIQNFMVCDEKSGDVQKSSHSGGAKIEKKVIKKKKICARGSLIPIRK